MNIQPKPADVTITFRPQDYFLKKSDHEWQGEYMLVSRIDMSDKGKDDQEGSPVLYLFKEDAEVFRKAGFSETKIQCSLHNEE